MYDGYLYAIDLGASAVKIGKTEDPIARCKSYQVYDRSKWFVSPNPVDDAIDCEKRVIYLLCDYLYRGREFFDCGFSEAVKAIELVCFESKNGGFKDSEHLLVEHICLYNLPDGTKAAVEEWAKNNGHMSYRQAFACFAKSLREGT